MKAHAMSKTLLPAALLILLLGGCNCQKEELPPLLEPPPKPLKPAFDYDSPPQITIEAPKVPDPIKGPSPPIPKTPAR
jgi:hypothetical protein